MQQVQLTTFNFIREMKMSYSSDINHLEKVQAVTAYA